VLQLRKKVYHLRKSRGNASPGHQAKWFSRAFRPCETPARNRRACWKRQISDDQITALITQVEHDINRTFDVEVESRYIGKQVMHYLGKLDQVAYVRFASVYRDFADADDFARELQRMSQNPDMPCHSSEYVPKKKHSRFSKGKHRRNKEQDSAPSLPLEEG